MNGASQLTSLRFLLRSVTIVIILSMKKKMKMPMSAVSPLNTLTCSSVSPFPGAGSSWACPSSWPPASAWKRHKNNLTSNSVVVGWILFSVPFRITHIQVRHQWRLNTAKFKPLLGAYLCREGSLSCHIWYDKGPRFCGLIWRTASFSRL